MASIFHNVSSELARELVVCAGVGIVLVLLPLVGHQLHLHRKREAAEHRRHEALHEKLDRLT